MGQMANSADPQSYSNSEPPRAGLALSSLALAGVTLDFLLVTPAVWALARAEGVALWPAESAASALFLLLPAIIVVGAWSAHQFTIRWAPSFHHHLLRTAAGAAVATSAALAIFMISGGEIERIVIMAPLAGLVMICALHANYLGVVRSLVRSGVVDKAQPPARI